MPAEPGGAAGTGGKAANQSLFSANRPLVSRPGPVARTTPEDGDAALGPNARFAEPNGSNLALANLNLETLFASPKMCTLVILRRPTHDWPLLLAANRDEMTDRPSAPPGRHWEDRADVTAGLDYSGGGSWLGLNDQGVAAAVMNREGSLGPAPGKRSRGELVLEALDHAEAREAAGALADLRPPAYRPFNLVVADARDAYWLRHGGDGEVRVHPMPPGLHLLSATELDDAGHPRIGTFLERFRRAEVPDPGRDQWGAWQALLSDRSYPVDLGPLAAMNLEPTRGFGTVSSALIALPSGAMTAEPRWLHADGPPDRAPFQPVEL